MFRCREGCTRVIAVLIAFIFVLCWVSFISPKTQHVPNTTGSLELPRVSSGRGDQVERVASHSTENERDSESRNAIVSPILDGENSGTSVKVEDSTDARGHQKSDAVDADKEDAEELVARPGPAWTRTGGAMADGCTKVYLDIGSNIGVQVRKLLEAHLYRRARRTTSIFDKLFGPPEHRNKTFEESGLCAFGFEANPKHVGRLGDLERSYNKQGWRVHFLVPKAVSVTDGDNVTLYSNRLSKTRLGASIFHKDARFFGRPQKVSTMDITNWIIKHIQHRTLNDPKTKPVVLAKMDIEGSEYPVLTRMMNHGLLCKGIIDKMFMEWHTMKEAANTAEAVKRRFRDEKRCGPSKQITEVVTLDDETYVTDGFPLPV